MRSNIVRGLIVVCAFVLLPVATYAQEAFLIGTVTDSTGAVLPGVTIQAVHEASGNTFEIVTDPSGRYRIPVRIGAYRVTATLSGFTTVTRSGLEVLVGQTVVVNLELAPSTVAETVTVIGASPLVDTTQSSLGGNIDSRQMSELPVQGRAWTTLALLAPGNRTNAIGETPVQDRADVREFQMNVDGQQVSQELGIAGQPRYSRDSIAEFEFISNRFDASQGRSMGVQVNVVTKSGTNAFSGLFGGYFRDDSMNKADPVLGIVIPYSNQQYSGAFGGPIAPLLRQLRIRARAAYVHLANRLAQLQRHAQGQAKRQYGRRSSGLCDLAADAGDGQGARREGNHSVWPWRHQSPLGNGSAGPEEYRRARPVHADREQSGPERGPRRVFVLGSRPIQPDLMVEPSAGIQRHYNRRAADPVSRLYDAPQLERAAAPAAGTLDAARRLYVRVLIARSEGGR
jgi:hypothetical protein